MRPLNRIAPTGPAAAYKTYAISSPVSTHFRPGTCEEASCAAHAEGWLTKVDETTDLGRRQAYYIRKQAGRRYSESREPSGLTVFAFEAGQKCFAAHQVSLQRPENFLVVGGDYRGNPLGTKTLVHARPEHWVEDLAENLDGLKSARERG